MRASRTEGVEHDEACLTMWLTGRGEWSLESRVFAPVTSEGVDAWYVNFQHPLVRTPP